MCRQKNRHVVLVLQAGQVLPQVLPGARVETRGGFIEQQQLRGVEKRLGKLQPPLQAAGERLHQILLPFFESHASQAAANPAAQVLA